MRHGTDAPASGGRDHLLSACPSGDTARPDAGPPTRVTLQAWHRGSLEQVRQFAKTIVSDGGVQFVVLDRDTVVGWCDIRRNTFEGCRHVGILGIGLLADYRGKGIGPRFLRER
ncbi:MAG TPA: GNAT family N-acetyltransferase [Acidobacteria bacterium]|nr:GNAT family N-acetyltransferase [Acidobacteriota bacterium]